MTNSTLHSRSSTVPASQKADPTASTSEGGDNESGTAQDIPGGEASGVARVTGDEGKPQASTAGGDDTPGTSGEAGGLNLFPTRVFFSPERVKCPHV